MSPIQGTRSFTGLAKSRGVVIRAGKMSFVVGTLLNAINHGPALLAEPLSRQRLCQIMLTYVVPYVVSTVSSVWAIQDQAQQQVAKGT